MGKNISKDSARTRFVDGWIMVTTAVIVACLLVVGYVYRKEITTKLTGFDGNKSGEEQKLFFEKIAYWQEVIEKQPAYQRAHLELAILYAEIGDVTSAKMYFESAVAIDPNNRDNKKVELYIENKELRL